MGSALLVKTRNQVLKGSAVTSTALPTKNSSAMNSTVGSQQYSTMDTRTAAAHKDGQSLIASKIYDKFN